MSTEPFFSPGQAVCFSSQMGHRIFHGTIVRRMLKSCYLVDDHTGLKPRVIPIGRLQAEYRHRSRRGGGLVA